MYTKSKSTALNLGFKDESLLFIHVDRQTWTLKQLTLEPNSTSEAKMRRPSNSSENALPPLTLSVPAKFGQIKVLVPQIPALPQPVVVHYHLLCQCASSASPCRQERRGRGFGDQSAPGEARRQSERLSAPLLSTNKGLVYRILHMHQAHWGRAQRKSNAFIWADIHVIVDKRSCGDKH